MSGIGGLLELTNAPVDEAALARLSERLRARGPDGGGVWRAGPVGLVHRQLSITPDSLSDQQPYTSGDGALTITADARLDNRADLCAALGVRDDGQPDGALILAAYARWGEGCVERLLGDFAFAVWDARARRLFGARDHLGVRPFAYHAGPRLFAFASEVDALLALPDIPRTVNEVRVAAFLTVAPDPDHSFYTAIDYLPPGHTLAVAPGAGVRLRQYWDLAAPRETRLASNAAYAEAFRALLTEAVTARLRSDDAVGVMLSGGLDSSSVACLAQRGLAARGERLHTFSIVYDAEPEADEREYMAAVVAALGDGAAGRHHVILGDPVSMVSGIEDLMTVMGEPFFHLAMPLQAVSNAAAQAQGVRVLLDGNFGDTVVAHGELRLAELVGQGRWRMAAREAGLLATDWAEPAQGQRRLLWHLGLRPWLPGWVQGGLQRLRGRGSGPADERPAWARETPVAPAFATRMDRDARLQELQAGRIATYRAEQPHMLFLVGRDRHQLGPFNQLAARSGIELRHPFIDRRVVEFCLGLPSEQRLRDGWTRAVERDAMTGILPEAIARRRYKVTAMPAASRTLLTRDLPELERLLTGLAATPAAEWVDAVTVARDLAQLKAAAARGDYGGLRPPMARLWRVMVVLLWLRQTGAAP